MVNAALGVLENATTSPAVGADRLPAPIYVTDARGFVTSFLIPPASALPGARQRWAKTHWCVTWKPGLTDAGEFLPHDQCPMADAIHNKRRIRGVSAIAERPDGARVNFMPYPTPLLSATGELLGAVNILIDVTEQRQAGELRAQAVRCRRLAAAVGDARTSDMLERMAKEYDEKAVALDRAAAPPNARFSAPHPALWPKRDAFHSCRVQAPPVSLTSY